MQRGETAVITAALCLQPGVVRAPVPRSPPDPSAHSRGLLAVNLNLGCGLCPPWTQRLTWLLSSVLENQPHTTFPLRTEQPMLLPTYLLGSGASVSQSEGSAVARSGWEGLLLLSSSSLSSPSTSSRCLHTLAMMLTHRQLVGCRNPAVLFAEPLQSCSSSGEVPVVSARAWSSPCP